MGEDRNGDKGGRPLRRPVETTRSEKGRAGKGRAGKGRPAGSAPRRSGPDPARRAQDRPSSNGPSSDGTESSRQPSGPAIPPTVEARQLAPDVRAELSTLDRATADTVARHLVAAGELLGVGVAGADVVERAEGGCWGSAAQPTRTIRPNTRAVDLRMISLPG